MANQPTIKLYRIVKESEHIRKLQTPNLKWLVADPSLFSAGFVFFLPPPLKLAHRKKINDTIDGDGEREREREIGHPNIWRGVGRSFGIFRTLW